MARRNTPTVDPRDPRHAAPLIAALRALFNAPEPLDTLAINRLIRRYPHPDGGLYKRSDLIAAFHTYAGTEGLPARTPEALARIQLKPIRTASGVTPVTILTKPFPCPGTCVFCPNDVRMPKSYLSDEPGAQRAEQNGFDPYLQTMTRLRQYRNIGHPTDKVELIILGGTWSFYPESYQIWFVKRAFDALHDFGAGRDDSEHIRGLLHSGSQHDPQRAPVTLTLDGSNLTQSYNQTVRAIFADEMTRSRQAAERFSAGLTERTPVDEFATWGELESAQDFNESATVRCVGLVIETRPDHIDETEVRRVRRLGCTKVQIGFQSLSDDVLRVNKRGHDVAATRRAVKLLRRAGFKIHAHWMPNLYGSTPAADLEDFRRMVDDPDFRPDELKIYPCSLIDSAELMEIYQRGDWQPYTFDELLSLLKECFAIAPEYMRLTRVIRDIPSTDIVVGNKLTNFRQIVEDALAAEGRPSADIRAREVRLRGVEADTLTLDISEYATGIGRELFLQFITPERAIAGFLRLSLPDADLAPLVPELSGAAIIREVHVYGVALGIGKASEGRAQHQGLGSALIEQAVALASAAGYAHLAVISAVGTRGYYRARGFADAGMYQVRGLG
jgi:elongator complex protein 3